MYFRGGFCCIAWVHLQFFSPSHTSCTSECCHLEKHCVKGHLYVPSHIKWKRKVRQKPPRQVGCSLVPLCRLAFSSPSAGSICYMTVHMNRHENKRASTQLNTPTSSVDIFQNCFILESLLKIIFGRSFMVKIKVYGVQKQSGSLLM